MLERRLFERQQARLAAAYREAGAAAVGGLPQRDAGDHGRGRVPQHRRHTPPLGDPAGGRGAPRRRSGGARLMADDAHILVVDDDARLRGLLSRYLVRRGVPRHHRRQRRRRARQAARLQSRPDGARRHDAGRERSGPDRLAAPRTRPRPAGPAAHRARRAGGPHRRLRGRRRRLSAPSRSTRANWCCASAPCCAARRRRRRRRPPARCSSAHWLFDRERGELRGVRRPAAADRRRGGVALRPRRQAERGAVARGHRRGAGHGRIPANARSTCR